MFFSGYQAELATFFSFEAKVNPTKIIGVYELVKFILFSFISGGVAYICNKYFFKTGARRIFGLVFIASLSIFLIDHFNQLQLFNILDYIQL